MSSKKITKDTLDHIAHLARIGLTEEEKESFLSQLTSILEYIDIIQTVDTSKVVPSHQITNLKNITRPDLVQPSLPQDLALSQAQKTKDSYFQVHNTIKK